ELLGAGPVVPHRVGLSAISRLARPVSRADAAGVLPAPVLGGRRRERAGDRGDGRPDRRGPNVHLDRLPTFRLQLPPRLDEPPEERPAGNRCPDLHGRRSSLRFHRERFPEGRPGGGEARRGAGRPLSLAPPAVEAPNACTRATWAVRWQA